VRRSLSGNLKKMKNKKNDLRIGVFPTPYPNAVENERDREKGKIQASHVVDKTELSTACSQRVQNAIENERDRQKRKIHGSK
jgi:hypothetical protein